MLNIKTSEGFDENILNVFAETSVVVKCKSRGKIHYTAIIRNSLSFETNGDGITE